MAKPHRSVVPIVQLTSMHQTEHGRIRMGIKDAKGNPTKLDCFRFTSADKVAIEALAELYGGVARPWSDPKANPVNQHEVVTTASSIPVWLPTNGMTVSYEHWGARGRERECDGLETQVLVSDDEDAWYETVDCICEEAKRMLCKPITRLSVILPELNFAGIWRLQSTGWNAAQEMPGMMALIEQLQGSGIVEARLSMEERREPSKVKGKPGKRYVVPHLGVEHSSHEMLAGQAQVHRLPVAGESRVELQAPSQPQAALPPWQQPADDGLPAEPEFDVDDDGIVDAEIVDDDETPAMKRIAAVLQLDNAPRWGTSEVVDNLEPDAERKITALLDGKAHWSKTKEGGVVKNR